MPIDKGTCPRCRSLGKFPEVFERDMHRQCLCPPHYNAFKSSPEMIRKYRLEFGELNPDLKVAWDSKGYLIGTMIG